MSTPAGPEGPRRDAANSPAAAADLNAQRQQNDLSFLDSGLEFRVGDPAQAPLAPHQLAALTPESPGVEAVIESGLSARVFKLHAHGKHWAVKVARRQSRVHNLDGRTAFLNELRRHADIRALRDAGEPLLGVITPVYGSLRHGVLVSPWIAGDMVASFDERRLHQLLGIGLALHAHGLFEWDFSPGNVIDDGHQVWLFDFGYMYRFDPLTQFNSAGRGDDCPQYHLAERIEARNAFAWLLDLEEGQGLAAALEQFRMMKQLSLAGYEGLRLGLMQRGCSPQVRDWLAQIEAGWAGALGGDLHRAYLREGWRSHGFDLDDDLHGASCTPRTLQRAGWLIRTAQEAFDALHADGALSASDAALGRAALVRRYEERRRQAERLQVNAPYGL